MPDCEMLRAPRKVLKDPASGREVWQVSPDGRPMVKDYMYLNHFSPDEQYLVVRGAGESGQPLYRITIATGEVLRLPIGPVEAYHWNIHPKEPAAYFRRDGRIFAMHLETLHERLVADPQTQEEIHRNASGPILFSGSGRWFCQQFCYEEQVLPAPAGWSHWKDATFRRCGVARFPCAGGAPEVLYLHSEGMQHLMFCPADDDLLTFAVWPDYQNNAALADNHRARAWMLDGRGQFARPYLIMPKGQRATHEFWSADGSQLYYHWKSAHGWLPNGLGCLDRATEKRHSFYTDARRRLSHSAATKDGRWALTNCVEEPGLDELVLVEIATGRSETWRCPHQQKSKAWITYPSFSPSGRYALYSTDASGEPRVYLVPMQ